MNVQLIFNEELVKGLMPISENVAGAYMGAAMLEAQEIDLKQILGSRLLKALKEHEKAQDWASFPAYADLKENCQLYLAYRTVVRLIPIVATKIGNIGTVVANDEHLVSLSESERNSLIEDYSAKADFFGFEMQHFVSENRDQFAELEACACAAIEANLNKEQSTGIWLGGPRGFQYGGDC